jgi:putative DNA primase/helicase
MAKPDPTPGKKPNDNYYIRKGYKVKKSERRDDTEAGRLAAYIIDRIPDGYDVYKGNDINEEHLAGAIVEACGRYIRHCPQVGWMAYRADEGRWTERYAESAVQGVITHFGNLLWEGTSESRPAEATFARRILSSAGIGAIKNVLKHHPRITVEQDMFDADPDVLNCMGDLYNLRTGETRAAEPEDMLCKSTLCKAAPLKKSGKKGVPWDIPEMPKRFDEFMQQVTSKDGEWRPDLALFVLSFFGYSLTGDNGASFFVNFHGQGKNGKSVLLNLMTELFGDYAAPLPRDLVIEDRFASKFNLASLPGIRLAVLTDAPEGRLNMDDLKPLISGDPVSAQRKFMKDFTYKPTCKIAVGSNPKLTLKDTGMGTRRRIRMVPFDYTVPDGGLVTNLHRLLLKEEAPEILSLLIFFAHEYYRNGEGPRAFPPCKAVDEASREYMDSEDLVGRWKDERTEAAPGDAAPSSELYKDFKKWAEDENVRKIMSQNKFSEHLSAHVPEKKKVKYKWHFMGVRLKPGDGPG